MPNPGLNVNSGIFVTNSSHKADIKYGPWDSLEQFKLFIDSDYWSEGLTFGIREEGRLTEYWFVGGNLEEHIEEKYKSINAIVSFWISPPVEEIVDTLPSTPDDGYRVLHNEIIKEYDSGGDSWEELYGGTGTTLENGMAVIVKVDGVLTNQTYVYNDTTLVWENRTATVGIDESRYVTGYIDGKRRTRDYTGSNAPVTGSVRAITSTGYYIVDQDLDDLPTTGSGITYLEVLSRDDDNLIYRVYDENEDWIQKKVDGVYSAWSPLKGDSGENPMFRKDSGWLQWKLVSDSTWNNLVELTELQGPPGGKGDKGDEGPQGLTPELQVTATHLQWKYTSSASWNNLLALSLLEGEQGASSEFRVDGGFIQWKLETETSWNNLIALSELKGDDGEPGTNGLTPEFRVISNWLQWKYTTEDNTAWRNIYEFVGGNLSEIQESSTPPTDSHVKVWIKTPEYQRYEKLVSGSTVHWYQAGFKLFPVDVSSLLYTADPGPVTNISNGVTYDNGEFSIPDEVTSFTFEDDGKEYQFDYTNDVWVIKFNYLYNNMIYLYNFNDEDITDSVGTLDATNIDDVTYEDDTSGYGKAALFNGTSSDAQTAGYLPDYSSGEFSFAVRFYATANGAQYVSNLFGKEHGVNPDTSFDYNLGLNDSNHIRLRLLTSSFDGNDLTSTNSVTLNEWHTAIAIWDGTTARLIIDEVEEGSIARSSLAERTTSLIFGDSVGSTDNNRRFTGKLSQCVGLNKALTDKEIEYITNNPL